MATCKNGPSPKEHPGKKKEGWGKECGDPVTNEERLLVDILGSDHVAKVAGFPTEAKLGNLLNTIGWELPSYAKLTKDELISVAKVVEHKTNRRYDFTRMLLYPDGACCTCW